jgi:hypothetical protein
MMIVHPGELLSLTESHLADQNISRGSMPNGITSLLHALEYEVTEIDTFG